MTLPRPMPSARHPLQLAVVLAASLGPVCAHAGEATVTDRLWTQHVTAFVGMGVSSVGAPCTAQMLNCTLTGSNGSTVPQTGLAPATASLVGAVTGTDVDLGFSSMIDASWRLEASWRFDQVGTDAVLQATTDHQSLLTGAVGWNSGVPTLSRLLTSLNFQRLSFTLDAPTQFSITGSVWGIYNPILLRRDDGQGGHINQNLGAITSQGGSWFDANPGADWTFAGTGTLAAGSYWIENFTLAAGDSRVDTPWRFGQTFTLSLHDTLATPVPEPGSLVLMLAGVAGLGLRSATRRRQLRPPSR